MGLYLYNTHHHDGKRCVHEYWDGVAPRNSMPRPVCGYFAGVFGLAGAVCLCETTAFPDEASGAAGATGADWPTDSETPNTRHCPSTGANNNSKFTCDGTDGKNPAMCNRPFGSICGNNESCGSITATPE
ncbi:MAG: hypothetical protein ACK463_01595, partial [Bradyrhizobium sp.]